MPHQIQGSQTDFSFGEVDVALKRADQHPARKAGLRQMANARILNSGAIQDRPGRRALFPITNADVRIEELTLSAGNIFKISFGSGSVQIANAAGSTIATFVNQGSGAPLPWVSQADINSIVYAPLNLTITICFGHSMRPQVITWDGVATWTIADYAELVMANGQKRTPFFRLSPQNVTMNPTDIIGNIQVNFSADIVSAGMVGTRVRFAGRQILLGSVINSRKMNATVVETLPPAQTLTVSGGIGTLNVGDVLEGATTGAKGITTSTANIQNVQFSATFNQTKIQIGDAVTGATSGATGVVVALSVFNTVANVALSTGTAFIASEAVSGPHGSLTSFAVSALNLTVQLIQLTSANANFFAVGEFVGAPSYNAKVATITTAGPQAISVWDDEVMNNFRGFPASCFVDQFRLGFCNFPAVPGGILWSAINSPTDVYANDASSPDNAIFEITPGKTQVYYVVPGPEGSEFVFCDTKIYYIPISVTSPLVPGSVGFQLLSGDGSALVQPRLAQEAILYVNAGQNTMMAVIATGAFTRPFNTKNLSDFHAHLFTNIVAIAAPNSDGTFNERYAYVLNSNGSIVVGKYQPDSLQGNQPVIGWGPWSGAAAVLWIAAWNADVIFTSKYFGFGICEILDDTQYLDGAISVNAPPAAFAAPGGKGPLWFIPSQSVTLMDQVTRAMGTYQIDANGFIIPQNNGGENLAIASLVAGQPWTMTVEPFAPDAQSGADMHQRMELRQFSKFAVYVINATGFMFASLFSAKQTPTSPALGTMQQYRRVPAWNLGDDATKPPPLRETVEAFMPIGSSYDPRVAIIKDVPGPLQILEIAMEVSI